MPFWRLYYHIVWATHGRAALITPEVEPGLHRFLHDKTIELGASAPAVNGVPDHVHLLISIPPRLAVSDVVAGLKGASAHFVNGSMDLDYRFAWQRGYGVLSVGERQCSIATAYIERQKAHHAAKTTNTWLERTAIPDAGPPRLAHVVREATTPYDGDEMPF